MQIKHRYRITKVNTGIKVKAAPPDVGGQRRQIEKERE
jgi:hypothetical protein